VAFWSLNKQQLIKPLNSTGFFSGCRQNDKHLRLRVEAMERSIKNDRRLAKST
jgi:hypothetical protein